MRKKSARNYGVIYTGRVGVKMRRPVVSRGSRRIVKFKQILLGGPLHGAGVYLTLGGDKCTLPITVRGESGRYRAGQWEAS